MTISSNVVLVEDDVGKKTFVENLLFLFGFGSGMLLSLKKSAILAAFPMYSPLMFEFTVADAALINEILDLENINNQPKLNIKQRELLMHAVLEAAFSRKSKTVEEMRAAVRSVLEPYRDFLLANKLAISEKTPPNKINDDLFSWAPLESDELAPLQDNETTIKRLFDLMGGLPKVVQVAVGFVQYLYLPHVRFYRKEVEIINELMELYEKFNKAAITKDSQALNKQKKIFSSIMSNAIFYNGAWYDSRAVIAALISFRDYFRESNNMSPVVETSSVEELGADDSCESDNDDDDRSYYSAESHSHDSDRNLKGFDDGSREGSLVFLDAQSRSVSVNVSPSLTKERAVIGEGDFLKISASLPFERLNVDQLRLSHQRSGDTTTMPTVPHTWRAFSRRAMTGLGLALLSIPWAIGCLLVAPVPRAIWAWPNNIMETMTSNYIIAWENWRAEVFGAAIVSAALSMEERVQVPSHVEDLLVRNDTEYPKSIARVSESQSYSDSLSLSISPRSAFSELAHGKDACKSEEQQVMPTVEENVAHRNTRHFHS